jgi:hypothetical protein
VEDKLMKTVSLEHAVEAFAGLMVLLSVALIWFVHPAFIWLAVIVGVNLSQQAFTGFCPAAIVLRKLFGLKTERELATVTVQDRSSEIRQTVSTAEHVGR